MPLRRSPSRVHGQALDNRPRRNVEFIAPIALNESHLPVDGWRSVVVAAG